MMNVNIGKEANVPASLRANDSAYQSKTHASAISQSVLSTDQQSNNRLPNTIFNDQRVYDGSSSKGS